MTEHGEGSRHPFDPFEAHLRFMTTLGGEALTVMVERASLGKLQPMEAGSIHMIDPKVLEARRSWQGSVVSHRHGDPSDYPSEMSDAMEHCEPQFILRNLGRVERWGEPDEPLALEVLEVPHGLPPRRTGHTLDFQPATPDLKLSVQRLLERKREDRWLFRELPWETRFCRELKERHSGPLWRYVPSENEGEE